MWLHMLPVFSFIVWDALLIWGLQSVLRVEVLQCVCVCVCVCTIDVGASEVPYADVCVCVDAKASPVSFVQKK